MFDYYIKEYEPGTCKNEEEEGNYCRCCCPKGFYYLDEEPND